MSYEPNLIGTTTCVLYSITYSKGD